MFLKVSQKQVNQEEGNLCLKSLEFLPVPLEQLISEAKNLPSIHLIAADYQFVWR